MKSNKKEGKIRKKKSQIVRKIFISRLSFTLTDLLQAISATLYDSLKKETIIFYYHPGRTTFFKINAFKKWGFRIIIFYIKSD